MTQQTPHNDREFSPSELAGAGLRTFFNIARVWRLSRDEILRILGVSDSSLLDSWMANQVDGTSPDTLERVSNVLGIFKAINTLLPVPERADAWLRAPNAAPLFGGCSALDQITTGRLADLSAVRHYLDRQVG